MGQRGAGYAADAALLQAEAQRVMALRRAEPFDPAEACRTALDLSCFEGADRQDGSLDLDTLLTQRRRLRLLARAERSGALEGLDGDAQARCRALLAQAPAYHRCVKAVLAMHSLFFGDEGGMELTEGDPDRASLRQTLADGLRQLTDREPR